MLIQKGHCVNYGAPITQAIRLAVAEVVEIGVVNRSTEPEVCHELAKGNVAVVVTIESHHTVKFGWVKLSPLVELAHDAGVLLILDAAAHDLRLAELINCGEDLAITSAHKSLYSTTSGIVAGRKGLVDAVYLQNRGFGRGMKAGKEAIFGAIAALEFRMHEDISAWMAEQDRHVQLILNRLTGVSNLQLSVDPYPNGCPSCEPISHRTHSRPATPLPCLPICCRKAIQ